MFDENQPIVINVNKGRLGSLRKLGYNVVIGDSLNIKAKDLTKGSDTKVIVVCDYCGNGFPRQYKHQLNSVGKDCCKACVGKKANIRHKLDIEHFKPIYEEHQCVLLEGEYINSNTPMRFTAKCGHGHCLSLNAFKKSELKLCAECGNKRYTTDEVKDYFKLERCILKDIYINNHTKMRYEATCGHDYYITFNAFKEQKQGRICPLCTGVGVNNIDGVRNMFKDEDCKLLSDIYKGNEHKYHYTAQCGCNSDINVYDFLGGHGRKCFKCSRTSGEDHHWYKHELTEDDRNDFRTTAEYQLWRRLVYERDSYACQCCGDDSGGNLNAHHIRNYADNLEVRIDVSNGITLCEDCHLKFHRLNRRQNNTKEQLDLFFELSKR